MEQVLQPAPAFAAKDGKQLKLEAVVRPAPGDQKKEDLAKIYGSAATKIKKVKTFKGISAGLTPEEEAEAKQAIENGRKQSQTGVVIGGAQTWHAGTVDVEKARRRHAQQVEDFLAQKAAEKQQRAGHVVAANEKAGSTP